MKKPKAVDTSKQDAILEKQQAEETATLEKKTAAAKRKRKGRQSLLYPKGTEEGVTAQKTTLG